MRKLAIPYTAMAGEGEWTPLPHPLELFAGFSCNFGIATTFLALPSLKYEVSAHAQTGISQ